MQASANMPWGLPNETHEVRASYAWVGLIHTHNETRFMHYGGFPIHLHWHSNVTTMRDALIDAYTAMAYALTNLRRTLLLP